MDKCKVCNKEVLFCINDLNGGGAEKILLNTIKNMDRKKYNITVLLIYNEGIYLDKIKELSNVNIKYIFDKRSSLSKVEKELNLFDICMEYVDIKDINGKLKYDTVIAFLEGIATKIISYSNVENKIAWVHCDIINYTSLGEIYTSDIDEAMTYEKYNHIICVSEDVKKQFEIKTNIKVGVDVITNIIEVDEIIEKANECIDEKFSNKYLNVISVGRLTRIKSYDRLLAVHKRLIDDGIYHNLYILGKGYKENELIEYIDINKINDTVHLLGFKENPYKYIKNGDIFVCSSISEGFSTVISEAIILNKPIVTTRCSGMEDILGKNNEFGYIVDNSEEGIYKGLKEMILSNELRKKYIDCSKDRVNIFNKKSTLERIYEKIENI